VCDRDSPVLTLYGIRVLEADREVATDLARAMREEREMKETSNTPCRPRTAELDEAQRILQRMWWARPADHARGLTRSA